MIKASKPEHSQRGGRLLSAYNGGADVPRYARKPPPGAAAAAGRPAQAAAAGVSPVCLRLWGWCVMCAVWYSSAFQPPACAAGLLLLRAWR